jgi:hypothetical protein
MLQDLIAKVRATDPKLVAAGVAYVATYVVSDLLNVGLEDQLLGAGAVNLTYGQAVAFLAAAAAGWWKANAATILRTPQEDGNPALPVGFDAARTEA